MDGLYWWPVQKVCIAVSGQRVFKITDSNGTYTEITGHPYAHDTIQKLVRVTWADFGDRLYFANGGEISVVRGADIAGLDLAVGTDADHDIAISAGSAKNTTQNDKHAENNPPNIAPIMA